jgi:hypothetical protein
MPVNFKICRKCECCEQFTPPEYDKEGSISVLPFVICGAGMCSLLMNDDPPPSCPYITEQFISICDLTDSDLETFRSLSGNDEDQE